MAVSHVVFASVSSLSITGIGNINNVISCSLSRGAETRPIFAFNSEDPIATIFTKSPGTGSFSYIPFGDLIDFSTMADITITGGLYPPADGGGPNDTQTISLTGCKYAGQNISMNANNEMVVAVNFTFLEGSW